MCLSLSLVVWSYRKRIEEEKLAAEEALRLMKEEEIEERMEAGETLSEASKYTCPACVDTCMCVYVSVCMCVSMPACMHVIVCVSYE